MKQPEAFKRFRNGWEKPPMADDYYENQLEAYRQQAIKAIQKYKTERDYLKAKQKEEEELKKYFAYLDSIEEGKR